jgi:hypothetical protein
MKYVGQISEKKDVVNVQYIDDKTSVFTTSVSDDFLNNSKLENGYTAILDSGKIRATYPAIFQDTFSTKNYFDNTVSSQNIDIDTTNGILHLSGGKTGTFISEPYTFPDSVSQIAVTTNYNDTAEGAVCLSSETTAFNTVTYLSTIFKNIESSLLWYFYTNVNGHLIARSYDYLTETYDSPITLYSNNTYTYTYSSTNIKNIAVCGNNEHIFILFPDTDSTLRLVKMTNAGNLSSSADIFVPSGYSVQNCDMIIVNNQLQIAYCLRQTTGGTGVVRALQYQKRNLSDLASVLTPTANNVRFVNAPTSGSTDGYYGCSLVHSTGNNVGVVGFYRGGATTGQTTFAIINGGASSYTEFRTDIATSTAIYCGQGDMVWDGTNNLFRIVALGGSTSATVANELRVCTIGNANDSVFSAVTTITPADMSNGFFASLLSLKTVFDAGSQIIHTFLQLTFDNSTWSNPCYRINTSNQIQKTIATTTSSSVRGTLSILQLPTTNNFRYLFSFNNVSQPDVRLQTYDFLKPRVTFDVRPSSGSSLIGGEQSITSGFSKSFNLSTSNTTLRFIFRFYFDTVESDVNGSVSVDSYTVEQTSPSPSGVHTSFFITKPLVTDRIVSEVTLNVTQTIPNGSIQWQVASLGVGDTNWQNVTLVNGSATVQITNPGSNLRLKATLTKPSGAVTLNDLPTIDSYSVFVRNVLVANDLLPLQINLMKLGLQVTTLTTAQRFGFTNMMIDLFETQSGVTLSGTSYNSGSISGTGTVTSAVENTDGNIFPTRIIIVDDSSTTGITYQAKRTNGDWETVPANTVYSFTSGNSDTTNTIQIRATLNAQTLYGWAYLYA